MNPIKLFFGLSMLIIACSIGWCAVDKSPEMDRDNQEQETQPEDIEAEEDNCALDGCKCFEGVWHGRDGKPVEVDGQLIFCEDLSDLRLDQADRDFDTWVYNPRRTPLIQDEFQLLGGDPDDRDPCNPDPNGEACLKAKAEKEEDPCAPNGCKCFEGWIKPREVGHQVVAPDGTILNCYPND